MLVVIHQLTMTEISDIPKQGLTEALKDRIYYNPLIGSYGAADHDVQQSGGEAAKDTKLHRAV